METAVKKGAFGRPIVMEKEAPVKKASKTVEPRRVQFRLVVSHEAQKPRDKATGQLNYNPYPDLYIVPSAGVAVNPDSGEQERWRYLFGYNSIWEKDQQNPEPSLQRLGNVDGKNDLQFDRGSLFVNSSDKAKIQALKVQDIFDGNTNQVQEVPYVYTMIDADRETMKVRNSADEAFEAESLARRASFDEMVAVAMAFGIDIQNAEADEETIRTKFIFKAKENPALFSRVFNDPKNRIKFLTTKALSDGSLTVNDGVLSYNGVAQFQVKMDADIAEQVAGKAMNGEASANKLYDTLKALS